MVQSVELLLDPGLEEAVRREWHALAGADLPSLASHTSASHRPHVTLLAATSVPDPVAARLPQALADLPVDVRLGGLVLFGSGRGRVLARLVVASPALLELHRRVLALAGDCPGLSATSRVGGWTPHVTLARRLPVEALGRAVEVLGGHEVDGRAVAARRWDGEGRREWRIHDPVDAPDPTIDRGD